MPAKKTKQSITADLALAELTRIRKAQQAGGRKRWFNVPPEERSRVNSQNAKRGKEAK